MKKRLLISTVLTVGILVCSSLGHAKNNFITIGSGGITGIYYFTGRAIAKIVNLKKMTMA